MDLRRSVDHSKAPPSVFSGNSRTIIPRLKRYISEIAEITAKIIPPEDDVLEKEADLLAIEEYLTVQGLRRQLAQAEILIGKLQEANEFLERRALDAESIPDLNKEIASLTTEKRQLQQSVTSLESDLERCSREHATSYNALRELFQKLESQSNENIELCDRQRIRIESLTCESESWKDRAEVFESQIKVNGKEFQKLQDAELQRMSLLLDERNELKKELASAAKKFKEESEQKNREHENQFEALQDKTQRLEEELKSLKDDAHRVIANDRADGENQKITDSRKMGEDKKKLISFQKKYKEVEISLKAATQRVSELQISASQTGSLQYDALRFKEKVEQWCDAASILTKDTSGVQPTPARLRAYLNHNEKWREDHLDEIQRLRETNSELCRRESNLKDELNHIEIKLNEERIRREASEHEANILMGQIKGQTDLMLKIKRARLSEDPVVSSDENTLGFEELHKIVEQFDGEKEKFIQLISLVRQQNESLSAEKDDLYKQRETTCLQFKRLEENFHRTRSDLSESKNLLAELKKTIELQNSKIKMVEQSTQFQQLELLRKQRADAETRSAVSMGWFINELTTFRSVVKALLGWYIRLDRNHSGDKLTVTLVPAITESPSDDETFICFDSHIDPVPIPLSELPSAQLEEYVWKCFKHEDFEMRLAGRYVDAWEGWRDQFSARQSFPALLAIMTINEQSRVMSWNSSLSSCLIRQTMNST